MMDDFLHGTPHTYSDDPQSYSVATSSTSTAVSRSRSVQAEPSSSKLDLFEDLYTTEFGTRFGLEFPFDSPQEPVRESSFPDDQMTGPQVWSPIPGPASWGTNAMGGDMFSVIDPSLESSSLIEEPWNSFASHNINYEDYHQHRNECSSDFNGSDNVGKLLPNDNNDLMSSIPDYLNLNPELPAHLMFGYPDFNPYPEFPSFPVMESYPAGRDGVPPVLNDLVNSDALRYYGGHDDSCSYHEDEGIHSRKSKPTTPKTQSKPLSLEDLTYDSSRFAKVVKAFLSIEDEKMRTVPEIAKRVDEMFPGQYSDFEGVKRMVNDVLQKHRAFWHPGRGSPYQLNLGEGRTRREFPSSSKAYQRCENTHRCSPYSSRKKCKKKRHDHDFSGYPPT